MRSPGPTGGSNAVSTPPAGCVVPSGRIVSRFTRAWIATPRGAGTVAAREAELGQRRALGELELELHEVDAR